MTDDDYADLFFDESSEVRITRRNLPHWNQEGKLYFVTWRLGDSLPQVVLAQLRADRAAWLRRYGNKPLSEMEYSIQREWYRLFDHRVQVWLDAGSGSCVLRRPEARKIMVDALHHFNGQRYQLGTFAVAGNHVHVLVAPQTGFELSGVMHSWKSFTANAINKRLGLTGKLWRPESFDWIVRNEVHLGRIERYIRAHDLQGAYGESRDLRG
ncbi:MAG: transposase [Flavobacteriales bacterium]